jgi:hypothetical protein
MVLQLLFNFHFKSCISRLPTFIQSQFHFNFSLDFNFLFNLDFNFNFNFKSCISRLSTFFQFQYQLHLQLSFQIMHFKIPNTVSTSTSVLISISNHAPQSCQHPFNFNFSFTSIFISNHAFHDSQHHCNFSFNFNFQSCISRLPTHRSNQQH